MPQCPILGSISLVHRKNLESQLSGLFIEGVGQLLVIQPEAIPRFAWIGVAIPFPRIDFVDLDLLFHLLHECRFVGPVPFLVPVMVRSTVSLSKGPLPSRQS